MTLILESQPVPLTTDPDGGIRVGGTRVTLDTVISVFREGATAEEIVQQYPALRLPDVYQVIAYYLRFPSEVENYLQKRESAAEEVRREMEARHDPVGIRDRLLARRQRRP